MHVRPTLLAPAGDLETFQAALNAGADAIYLGLDEGFNARARARNFSLEQLPGLVRRARLAGVELNVTLNTLLFESELDALEHNLREVARAGVDAIIVQDPAVALIAKALCPELVLHASTQMTLSSPQSVRFAETLGIQRVVLPRELSVEDIAHICANTELETEVFVHGALCVSWSGQCLSSEAWGGRSANRGVCAQACRMPYTLEVDGAERPMGEVKYLLSPKDMSAQAAIPALVDAGVTALKIEGRLKSPAYVMTSVQAIRDRVDAHLAQRAPAPKSLERSRLSFSRGFSEGFLQGSQHQTLVDGRFPKHRGAFLGLLTELRRHEVRVSTRQSPSSSAHAAVAEIEPRAGMGVVFDAGHPEDRHEQGGPIFSCEADGDDWLLRFGTPGPDLSQVAVGNRVWVTSDPSLEKEARSLLAQGDPDGRLPLSVVVRGGEGEVLVVEGQWGAHHVEVRSSELLSAARDQGLSEALLRDKLGALGGTPFFLASLFVDGLHPGLHLPVSRLKALRRELTDALSARVVVGAPRTLEEGGVHQKIRERLLPATGQSAASTERDVELIPLCRTDEQLGAVIEAGFDCVELDWMELIGLGRAVKRAHEAGLRVGLATLRVQKAREEGYDSRLAKMRPDSVLVRHWGAVMEFRDLDLEALGLGEKPVLHGDFSLNVTNSLTALHLLGLGLDTVTAAHDLDATQLFALIAALPEPHRLAVAVHHHIPTFHTEHCIYAHNLSDGSDRRTCGAPCAEHRVTLKDHKGRAHLVLTDAGCRNTVFNAAAQSAAHLVPRLIAAGIRRLRIEFVWENREEVSTVLDGYRQLLAGTLDAKGLLQRISAHEQFGVGLGTMQVLA